jgi:hypothetical protein
MRTFRPNAGNSGNALNKFAGPTRKVSPFEFDYRNNEVLGVGDYVRLRIFTLDEQDIQVIPCKRGNIVIPGKPKPISKVVHNLGSELADLTDGNGVPFAEWQGTVLYRIPVWIYGVNKGGVYNEIEKLMFIEIGPGLKKSLDEVKDDPSGMFAFDEKTNVPEYDLMLQIVKGEGDITKNYLFRGINMDPKSRSIDANYNVPAEQVLEEDANTIADTLDSTEYKEAIGERMTVDYIRNEFRPRNQNGNQGQTQSPISNRFAGQEQERTDYSNDRFADDAPSIPEQQAQEAEAPTATREKRKRNFNFNS